MSVTMRIWHLDMVQEGTFDTMEEAVAWAKHDGLQDATFTGILGYLAAEQYVLATFKDTGRPPSKNKHGFRWFWRHR